MLLGLKANVSEAEHPLLCESTRRQRGELAIAMLVHYKDDPIKLSKVMLINCSVILINIKAGVLLDSAILKVYKIVGFHGIILIVCFQKLLKKNCVVNQLDCN